MFVQHIRTSLVQHIIKNQFPEYSHLPVIPVQKQGCDNISLRLGNDMLIRMPRAKEYSMQVKK